MEEIKIERYLLNKGLQPHLKGFRYMATAIKLCQDDHSYLLNLTTKLYPTLAKLYDDTFNKTERALRTQLDYLPIHYTIGYFIGLALIELRELSGGKSDGFVQKDKKKTGVSKSKIC